MGLGVPDDPTQNPAIAAWSTNLYEAVRKRNDDAGFLTARYFGLNDPANPARGIRIDTFGPRYSTGYLAAMNRPSMLVETHVLKPYRQRVEGTYAVMKHTIEHCIDGAAELKGLIAAADAGELAVGEGAVDVVGAGPAKAPRPFLFKGLEYAPYKSEVTGGTIRAWKPVPVDVPSSIVDQFEPGLALTSPAAYAVPMAWAGVIDRLKLHGLKVETLKAELTDTFATYRFEDVKFPSAPFEGRFSPSYRAVPIQEARTLGRGTAIIRANQVGRKLLAHLLEPAAPDSLVRWGEFNAIFEQKEYGESYAVEPMAKRMLAENAALRAEFEEKLKDPAFAASPGARLDWLYERSPYWDVRLRKYPVVRLTSAQLGRMKP